MTLLLGEADNLKRQRASRVAGLAAATIAVAALIGLWAGRPLLASWGSGFAAMKPMTALCPAALGLALMYPGEDSRFALVVGLAVAAIATLDLGLLLFGIELGIGSLQMSRSAVLRVASFTMPHATALGVALVGVALALSRFEQHRLAVTAHCSLTGAASMFVLLGYLTGIDTLYGSTPVSSLPLPTAVGLLCVAGGIILRIGIMPALRKPRPLWQLFDRARMCDRRAARAIRRICRGPSCGRAARPNSRGVDESSSYFVSGR